MGPVEEHLRPLGYERRPQYIAVAWFNDCAEAAMAATLLEGESLDFEVAEHTRLHGFGVRAATLVVAEEDLARAVEVLARTPARRCLLVERVTEPADPVTQEPPLLRWLRRIGWRR